MLEPAGGRRRRQGSQRRGPPALEAGRLAGGGAARAQPQFQPVLPDRGGKRVARDTDLRAVHFPPRRQVRGVEGHRDQFQPAIHVPELTSEPRTPTRDLKSGSMSSRLLLDRRALLAGTAAFTMLSAMPLRHAAAAVRLDVTQGTIQPMPIALPDFVGGAAADGEAARGVSQVITSNLRRSGLFNPIDPAAYIEKITNIDTTPRFDDWRTINAQALVTGRLQRQ